MLVFPPQSLALPRTSSSSERVDEPARAYRLSPDDTEKVYLDAVTRDIFSWNRAQKG